MDKAPKGREFVFVNGRKSQDLKNFSDNVKKLSPEEFRHHVNDERHDFSQWVKDCIDPEVGMALEGVSSHKGIVEKLEGYNWEHKHRRRFGY